MSWEKADWEVLRSISKALEEIADSLSAIHVVLAALAEKGGAK